MKTEPLAWTPFECDGRTFEYATMPAKQGTRPAGWPAHKPSPRRAVPVILVLVRRVGDKTSAAMVYPDGTVITTEHVLETARLFWAQLTG